MQVVGGGVRKCKCYKCGSTDRERLVYVYLQEYFSQQTKQIEVLHIAPEKCLSNYIVANQNVTYHLGDINPTHFPPSMNVEAIDIQNIPYSDNTFDIVICNHVLEHVVDVQKSMMEIHRVIKADGIAILQVPISNLIEKTLEDPLLQTDREREQAYGQKDHLRLFGRDYGNKLKSVGFNVEVVRPKLVYSKFGVNMNESLFVCSK